jgi:hypothetical protein
MANTGGGVWSVASKGVQPECVHTRDPKGYDVIVMIDSVISTSAQAALESPGYRPRDRCVHANGSMRTAIDMGRCQQ